MFYDDLGGEQIPPAGATEWAFPGRPADAAALALTAAVDTLLDQDAAGLVGSVALQRCRTVLAQVERLGAVAATALPDVQARQMWATDGPGRCPGGGASSRVAMPAGPAGPAPAGCRPGRTCWPRSHAVTLMK